MADTTSPMLAAPKSDLSERVLAWVRGHRQLSTYGAGALVLVALFVAWNWMSARSSEDRAYELLNQARVAFESGNMPLAASEFARIAENYSGTKSAEQATLLLAQVRMLQGQSPQAIEVLRRFTGSASPEFRAQAWQLLGAAFENVAQWREAAEAYESAADHAQLPFLAAQFLSDAGRTWTTAGDTARAVAAFTRIGREYGDEPSAREALVRLGELTRGQAPIPEKAK